jgi:proline dehydrogenase
VRIADRLIAASLPAVPKPVVRHFADRYMAGESRLDALATVRELNETGAAATLDVLGESVTDAAQATAAADEYTGLLGDIAEAGLNATVSVKLTAFGLEIEQSLALDNVRRVVEAAAGHGSFVRIDMEHSDVTDRTLGIYRTLRGEGFDNVGIVLQSYLRRTEDDLASLAPLKPSVRLVKGIYVEPEQIAFTDPAQINREYIARLEDLFRAGCTVASATHDEELIAATQRLARELNLPRERYEFEMLLGVRENLSSRLLSAGERVRIYVPYGDAWYAYSVRRLRENPSIAGYVARDVLRSFVPGM